jgi:hypothetical protein
MIAADTRSPANALQTFRASSGSLAIFAAIRRPRLIAGEQLDSRAVR